MALAETIEEEDFPQVACHDDRSTKITLEHSGSSAALCAAAIVKIHQTPHGYIYRACMTELPHKLLKADKTTDNYRSKPD